MPNLRRTFRSFAIAATLLFAVPAAAADFMFRANVDGESIEGRPVAWTDDIMHLLGRDGRLHTFHPSEAKDAKKTSPSFYGYSVPETIRELRREFGDGVGITTTKHYIVVHPPGTSGKWANHFEELYRSFFAYFRVRGFKLDEPKYPLVAVVYNNQAEFERRAKEQRTTIPEGLLGFYLPTSNRVQMYDVTQDHPNVEWSKNAETIIHEATHQTAFNVGIHNRFTMPPKWLAEGLATMFEAPGVWNSQSFHSLNDRINKQQLAEFRARLADHKPGTFGNLIASDRMFQTDAGAAYAEAWAMTFFLCETRPRQLAEYFKKTAARPDFTDYFATQRVADFKECFGSDLKQLEASFLAWMKDLPAQGAQASAG
jgi:hypothetical protein